MSILDQLAQDVPAIAGHRPWPRYAATVGRWEAAAAALAAGEADLLGLWGEPDKVHMSLHAEGSAAILSLACPDGSYPSVARHHPPALRLERAAVDLFGLAPEGLPDPRPWLDHGLWGRAFPLAAAPRERAHVPYRFLPASGESLHEVPVGPVHAGIIEPGHFRFTANGEAVVRVEPRLGYTHKGVEALMVGADLARAARLAGRVSGDSTVAYAWAFAMAAEAALGVEPPERALWLRALMAELERLANHLGDVGAICNDAAFPLLNAHFSALRERVLRAADTAFGHRLMRDRIVVGGVAHGLEAAGRAAIEAALAEIGRQLPRLVEIYDETASLQDRTVGTGVVRPELARQYAAGGYVGRAAGRAFDARAAFPYAPYDRLEFEVPVRQAGDVDARAWIRIEEIGESLKLLRKILDALPAQGPLSAPVPSPQGVVEGVALVEGFRGDILVWLRLSPEGKVARCHLRDPSWFHWPLIEAAIEGNIIADFPLINKSFNGSYSGHDL